MKNKNYGIATVVGSSDNFTLLVKYECGYYFPDDEAIYFEEAKDIITGEKLYRVGYASTWTIRGYFNCIDKAIEMNLASRKKLIPISIKNISEKEMKDIISMMTPDDIVKYYYNMSITKNNYLNMISDKEEKTSIKKIIKKIRRQIK